MPENDNDTAVYAYVGDGLGIPGLPHRLSKAQARDLQVLKAFEQAISAGVYIPEGQLPAETPEESEK